MPLVKFQIRNEYGLADPELYRAADKDDPEALLEGVAMAGLVGVLRQLGDLAEFAAEIFHDLHEEVLATAARGHGLMVRVQQLESEFPQIEKILLTQTNPLPSISNTGVDWHPNLHTKQNLISGGDLPRFVMDSYEECRGPPRLFLLDKFDVAGAGACLKRYTDPSIFKTEAPIDEVQREKKIRKLRRKGLNGRNGETPDITAASHAKLHQLFLVESIENRYNDPARIVKLKKRQLNESPFDSRNGRSYMEDFVESFSPDSKTVHEVSVAPQPLPWIPDHTTEAGNDVLEVSASVPVKNLSEQNITSSPGRKELSPRPSEYELGGDAIHDIVEEHFETAFREETDKSPLLCEVDNIKSFEEVKTGSSVDGCHSDELTSEVENYMDALATIESETDTDNEYWRRADKGFVNVRKHGKDFDANDDQLELQAQFSDTQSVGCSVSDDGNSYFRKGSSNFSFSDNQSNSTENLPSDNDGIAKAIHYLETDLHESENGMHDRSEEDSGIKDDLVTEGELSKLQPSVSESDLLAKTRADEVLLDDAKFVPGTYQIDEAREDRRTIGHTFNLVPGEGVTQKSIDGLDDVQLLSDITELVSERKNIEHAYNSVSHAGVTQKSIDNLDDVQHSSDIMELASERKNSEDHLEKVSDIIHVNNESSGGTNIDYPVPSIHSAKEQLNFSALPEQIENLDLTSSLENTPASLACDSNKTFVAAPAEVDDDLTAGEMIPEGLTVGLDMQQNNFLEQQPSNIAYGIPLDNVNLQDFIAQHERKVELGEPSEIVQPEDIKFTQNTETVGSESVPLELQSHTQSQEEHVNEYVDDFVAGRVLPKIGPATLTVDPVDNILPPADMMSSSIQIEEFASNKRSLPEKEFSENGAASSECIEKIEMTEKVDESEVACVGFNSLHASMEQPIEDIDMQNTSLVEHSQTILCKDNIMEAPADSKPGNDFEVEPSNETETSREDAMSKSKICNAEREAHLEKSNKLEGAESEMKILCKDEGGTPTLKAQPAEVLQVHDVELLPTDEDTAKLFALHSQPFLNGMVQQKHDDSFALSFVHDQPCQSSSSNSLILSAHSEGPDKDSIDQSMIPMSTNIQGTEFCPDVNEVTPEDKSPQSSSSKSLILSAHSEGPDKESIDQTMISLSTNIQGIEFCPNANEVAPENEPPLPTLPYVKWTDGELHHSFLSSQENSSKNGLHAFPSKSSFVAYVNTPADSQVSDREVMQSGGAFSAITDGEEEKLQHVSESTKDDLSNECLLPSKAPDVDSSVLNNDSTMRGAKLSMESSAEPTTIMEQSALTLDSGRQSIQFGTNAVSPTLADEERNFMRDQVSPQPVSVPVDSPAPSATMVVDQQHISKNLEVDGESHVASGLSLLIQDEHLKQNLLLTNDEDSCSTTKESLLESDAGKINGSLINNIPRPPKPLIEAVAAHDRSKLRKVSEMIRPEIGPKVEERDSLLEQIRTKSFNLKPALLTRPSMQGPRTNLTVTAILEKANAMRQVLADSDEDDSDGWSDS